MVQLIKSVTEFEVSPTLGMNETVTARRAQGKPVSHMGFGESPFPVVPRLENALQAAASCNKYQSVSGMPPLIQAVSDYYAQKAGIDAAHYDVLVAPGSKLILYGLQMAIEGDLLMPVPSWVSYEPQAKMLHNHVIKIPTTLDDEGYHIDAQDLRELIRLARSEGKSPSKIILNYPNNPTGLTIPDEELEAIAAVCMEEDIFIISDEIYGLVSFDKNYRSIAQYAPSHTAISTGLSKHLSLGGWRLGVGFIPKAVDGLYPLLRNIASETWSCVSTPIQMAATEAYQGHADIESFIGDVREIHAHMNTYIARGLRTLGIIAPTPQGGFYNYPDFAPFRSELNAHGIQTSKDLSDHLLEGYGIATLPGVAFGAEPSALTLRLSGCDYDGAKVLEAYRSGKRLDDGFVAEYAPNIQAAIKSFGAFIRDIASSKKAQQSL